MNFCKIFLIRHGETDWNALGRIQGQTNIDLNIKGQNQALILKEKLRSINFSAVFSSDLSRAKKTAEIVLGERKIKIEETPELRERCFGLWEGRFTHELNAWFEEKKILSNYLTQKEYLSFKWQDDIESYSDVYARLSRLIRLHSASHMGSSLLLSSHGGVLRSVLYHFDYHEHQRWKVSNCAYLQLQVTQSGEISLVESEGGAQLICDISPF